jgi:tRNA threonylcarbamoyladenosine biosynthesis protein TsaB
VTSRIVSIDTTSALGSLALIEDGEVVEEVPLHAPDGYADILFPQLQKLLARHGWRPDSVAGYAAAAGPGSFTGVRIGVAAVKGLAEAAGVKAAAVSNLKVLASFGSGRLRAPFCDARRGEVYGGLYDRALEQVQPEVVAPLARWLASLPRDEVEFVTPDPAPFEQALAGRILTVAPRVLAGAVGRLAAGSLCDPAALDANYVRRSDAELKWHDR